MKSTGATIGVLKEYIDPGGDVVIPGRDRAWGLCFLKLLQPEQRDDSAERDNNWARVV